MSRVTLRAGKTFISFQRLHDYANVIKGESVPARNQLCEEYQVLLKHVKEAMWKGGLILRLFAVAAFL